MSATSREIVYQTLNLDNPPRVPRQLWWLPWAEMYHEAALCEIRDAFPPDIVSVPWHTRETPVTHGDPCRAGTFVDEWGCTFENIQDGVIGEVKMPMIDDWERDTGRVHFPEEWLTLDTDRVNAFCGETGQFVISGCLARPFERMQFLRGSANLMTDLLTEPPGLTSFFRELHSFYCRLFEVWAKTDVDALMFMDDWGTQRNLLINPDVWEHWFAPCYRDFVEIAHGAGKKIFMHTDGYILPIYPRLVEIGVDAVNSQIFCMGVENLKPFRGRITFWGEIDRQHLLPEATPAEIDRAVRAVHDALWAGGGCIAQCEFGPGARPENVRQVFVSWDERSSRAS